MENEYNSNKKISELKPGDKNIDIKVIILQLISKNKLKNDLKITQFLVADHSGSIFCNFFDDVGDLINEGDIIFLKSSYATLFKNYLILYTSKPGLGKVIKLGEFFMLFNESPNMSSLPHKSDNELNKV